MKKREKMFEKIMDENFPIIDERQKFTDTKY